MEQGFLNMHLEIPSQQETYTKLDIIAYLHKPLNYFIIGVSFTSCSATKRSMETLIRNSNLWYTWLNHAKPTCESEIMLVTAYSNDISN